MSAVLLHLWGPFTIHTYGLFVTFGVFLFMFLVTSDQLFKKRNYETVFYDTLIVGILSALLGSRLLYIVTENEFLTGIKDVIAFWDGGLSVLGGIVGALIGAGCFLQYKQIAVLPFFDVCALYAPLLQAVARLGCFFAGCCYGMGCNYAWAIQYIDPDTFAPMHVYLHPTQLYSALFLFFIFLFLKTYTYKRSLPDGCVLTLYIMLVCAERFFVDFWRGDRIMVTTYFSYNQLCACGLVGITAGIVLWMHCTKKRSSRG